MVLTHVGQKYLCRSTYTEREMPKSAGFRWDPERKVWWTDDSKKALKLLNFADTETKTYLTKQEKDTIQSLSLSRATNANIKVPAPDGLQYLPFQKAGIAYTLARPAVLIGDEMGLGKTVEAIGVINVSPRPERVLVICPASLKVNWKRELERWSVHKLSIGIAAAKEPFPKTNVVIVNYDILDRFQTEWEATTFDYLIVDECHYVKNPGAKRTKAVLSIKAKKQIYMTGTPIVNRPKELWTVIHKLDPKTWTSFWRFAQRYCGAYHNGWGWDFSGASNLEELQSKLRATILVRRLKKDVLTELPDKMRQVIELPSNGFQKFVDLEWKAWRVHKDKIEELQKRIEEAAMLEDVEAYREVVKSLRSEVAIAFNSMAKVRHDTAVAKIPMVIEHLKDAVDQGKVVCFAHHHDVVDALAEAFKDECVVVDGRVKPAERMDLVDKFQKDPDCKLFIGSITAAGVGITLTAASHVVFAELDWVPGNVSQAEDRLHRIGQKNSVLVQHLVLEESLDAHMAKVIVKKQEVIEKALDKKALDKKGVKVTQPELFPVPTAKPKKQVLPQVYVPSSVVIEALKFLAARCDGARSLDGQGFNKMDADFGRDLASQTFLTPRQSEVGLKLVRKYSKQLPERLKERLKLR